MKAQGTHSKRLKKAIIERFFPGYKAYHKIGDSGFAHYSCGQIHIYKGTNHSGVKVRTI